MAMYPIDGLDRAGRDWEDAMATGRAVSIVHDFATEQEVALLRRWAATTVQAKESMLVPGEDGSPPQLPRHRLTVEHHLDEAPQALSRQLVLRALSIVQQRWPMAGRAMLQCNADDDLPELFEKPGLEFSKGEPAVNVYSAGGEFTPHRDHECLTLLLSLSSPEEFTGGGTAFWPPCHSIDDAKLGAPPSLVVKAPIGAVLLWSGVVTHAGRAVDSGKRVVWVASFSPRGRVPPAIRETRHAARLAWFSRAPPVTNETLADSPGALHSGSTDGTQDSDDDEEDDVYTESERQAIAAARAKAYANRAARRLLQQDVSKQHTV
jgi:hypothetical protein